MRSVASVKSALRTCRQLLRCNFEGLRTQSFSMNSRFCGGTNGAMRLDRMLQLADRIQEREQNDARLADIGR